MSASYLDTQNKSGFEVEYDNFEYKGHTEKYYFYDIPFEKFMEGVRAYFDNQMITIDGKDTDVWNALVELEATDKVFEAMKDWFKEHCKEAAYEEYKSYVDWYYDDED